MTTKQHIGYIIGLTLLCFCFGTTRAQNEANYSQYLFNIQKYNPAFVGNTESPALTLLARQQWVQFERPPQTQTFSFQSPLKQQKMGLGFSLFNEQIGASKTQSAFIDYSFSVKLGTETRLRMGISGGVSNLIIDEGSFRLVEPNDPAFSPEAINIWQPNFGTGLFLSKPNLYLGLSAPKLLNNQAAIQTNTLALNQLILMSAIVFNLSRNIDLRPAICVQYRPNEPVFSDIQLNFIFANQWSIGAMFRTNELMNFGINTNVLVGKNFRIGYAFDMFEYNGLSNISAGTHELMLCIELNTKKNKYVSPLYF